MTREMLKEAIADAKTIKETAIASAKSALEEAFAPQLTAMFAERLNELELEEAENEKGLEEEMDEMYTEGEEDGNLDEDFNLEELLAELSMEEEQESEMKEEGMDAEQLDEDLMLEEMSDEEIEELVMQVIDDMIASGKLMPGEGEEEGDEDEMADMDDMDAGDEEEIEGEEETEEIDEDINLEELLAEINSEEKIEESIPDIVNALDSALSAGDYKDVYVSAADAIKIFGTVLGGVGALAANEAGLVKKAVKMAANKLKGKAKNTPQEPTAEAKETEETIAELRNELNEVNLLNAKLLYTNKIFKAKNLTESEKIKVLNTFDKAETVKEVKLVFETLTESLKATTAKKNTIKESLGSASKTISAATPKQPIIETNEAFARMQRLAGLKK